MSRTVERAAIVVVCDSSEHPKVTTVTVLRRNANGEWGVRLRPVKVAPGTGTGGVEHRGRVFADPRDPRRWPRCSRCGQEVPRIQRPENRALDMLVTQGVSRIAISELKRVTL